MFTRTTLVTAMVASVAIAQTSFEVYTDQKGTEVDFDNHISIDSAKCSGTFANDASQEFFFGVSHIEGHGYSQLVGWGKNLCSNSVVNFDTDYTIQVIYDGATFETGQRLICEEAKVDEMIKNFANQVDDGSILKAVGRYRDDVKSGALTIVDPALSMQDDARNQAIQMIADWQGEQTQWNTSTVFKTRAGLGKFLTDAQTIQSQAYDAELQANLTEMRSLMDTQVNQLSQSGQTMWASQGEPMLDSLLTLIEDEYGVVEQNIITYIQDQTTTGDTNAQACGEEAQEIIITEANELRDLINGKTEFSAKKITKDIVKPMGTAELDANKKAECIQTAAADSTKGAQDANKEQKSENKVINKTVKDTTKADSKLIKAFLKSSDKKGSKKVSKEFKNLTKDVNNMSKTIIKQMKTWLKDTKKTTDSDIKTEFDEKKKSRKGNMDLYKADAASVIKEPTEYPEIDVDQFNLSYYLNAGFSVQVQLTRLSDSTTSSCTVEGYTQPADHCHHTTMDDMYFDYLCNMVADPVYKKQVMTCAETERPTQAYCNLLNDVDEAMCQGTIDNLEKSLTDAMAVADKNAADEWQVYEDILKHMDEAGISLFQNEDFLNWAYDHDIDNWDCAFGETQTWDYETSSTLDASGNPVTDEVDADGNLVTHNVCYTGHDPNLNLTKNSRTESLMNQDFSASATDATTTDASATTTPVVAASHPMVGLTLCDVYDTDGTCLTENDLVQYCISWTLVGTTDECEAWNFCSIDTFGTVECSAFAAYCDETAQIGYDFSWLNNSADAAALITCVDFTWPSAAADLCIEYDTTGDCLTWADDPSQWECVWSDTAQAYECPTGCTWDYFNEASSCNPAFITTSMDPVYSLAVDIEFAIYPDGTTVDLTGRGKDILTALMNDMTWLADFTVDETQTQASSVENTAGVVIDSTDIFSEGFAVASVDMATIYEIANCVHAAQLQSVDEIDASLASLDLTAELIAMIVDIEGTTETELAFIVPDWSIFEPLFTQWTQQITSTIIWTDYDYTIGAFDTAGLAQTILDGLYLIDTSGVTEADIQEYAYRLVDIVLYRDCANAQMDYSATGSIGDDITLDPLWEMFYELQWAVFTIPDVNTNLNTSALSAREVVGDFVSNMVVTDTDGNQSILAATDTAIEVASLATATQIYGSTPPDSDFLATDALNDKLVAIATCYFAAQQEAESRTQAELEDLLSYMPLEEIIIKYAVDSDDTFYPPIVTGAVYQFLAEIPTWTSQALQAIVWNQSNFEIPDGELQAIRQGVVSKMSEYGVTDSVEDWVLDGFIYEVVDQVLFGHCPALIALEPTPEDPDDYCSLWQSNICTQWQFCYLDTDTNTDVCSVFDDLCTAYDTDGVTCTKWDNLEDYKDVCSAYDTDGVTCLTWDQECWGYTDDSLACLSLADSVDYCTTWELVGTVDVCAQWQFCSAADTCSDFDMGCSVWLDTDELICTAWEWPPVNYIPEVCVSYATDDITCLVWDYECVSYEDDGVTCLAYGDDCTSFGADLTTCLDWGADVDTCEYYHADGVTCLTENQVDDYCTQRELVGTVDECVAWQFCTDADTCNGFDAYCTTRDTDDVLICTEYTFSWCVSEGTDGTCLVWDYDCLSYSDIDQSCLIYGAECTSFDADLTTCLTWDEIVDDSVCVSYATDDITCLVWDYECVSLDTDGVTCLAYGDDCTSFGADLTTCLDWGADVDTCDYYHADSVTCITESQVDDYCTQTELVGTVDECVAWQFCTDANTCNDFDLYCDTYDIDNELVCTSYSFPSCVTFDTDGTTCLTWSDDQVVDDGCTEWSADFTYCMKWHYDPDEYCVNWDTTGECAQWYFCLADTTTSAETCADDYISWCSALDADGKTCDQFVVPSVDDFCTTTNDITGECSHWNFCVTDASGTEICTKYFDSWCTAWDTNDEYCLAIEEPLVTGCYFDATSGVYTCSDGCWYDASNDVAHCYEDTNVEWQDCAELSADELTCFTDFDEYYEFARSCLPNEPLKQFVTLIEGAFFANLAGVDSAQYVIWPTGDQPGVNEKAVLRVLMEIVSSREESTGDFDASGTAITRTIANREASNNNVATIVETVGQELFAYSTNGLSDWLTIADANTSVDMDTLYDVYDAIKFVPSLTDEDKAWRARQVRVSDKLVAYASHMYGHDYSDMATLLNLDSLQKDFKDIVDMAIASSAWQSDPADFTINEIDYIVSLAHGHIADFGQSADYFGLTDAIIMDYVYEVTTDIFYGEQVCELTTWATGGCASWEILDADGVCQNDPDYLADRCPETQYYDLSSDMCFDYTECYPWQYINASTQECTDIANYTGVKCDLTTQYYDWTNEECVFESYCMPWETVDPLTNLCIPDDTYTGDTCDLTTQYYDENTETCITIPECNPWEYLDDTTQVCTDLAAYTGEICNDAQYYDWSHAMCLYISNCEYFQIEDETTGFCVDDPNYTGDLCDTSVMYYNWSTETCWDIPPCYPWQYQDDNTLECTDLSTYTGEVCDLNTQYYDWEWGQCHEDLYGCLPSEIKLTNGECQEDTSSSTGCKDYEHFDFITYTCVTTPSCYPWEYLDDNVCYELATYTGVRCNDAQTYNWSYNICDWISVCEYYQVELSNGECFDDPNYTGVRCDDNYTYYNWSSATCEEYPPCYPWETEVSGICVEDTTYTGEICDVDTTHFYEWEWGECIQTDYSCLPWEYRATSGDCVDDPDYTGDLCDSTQWYDTATLTCVDFTSCMPWETYNSGTDSCDFDDTYTGTICESTQWYDWEYDLCNDFDYCEPWQYWDDIEQICRDDTTYTGEICDEVTQYYDYQFTHTCIDIPTCMPWQTDDNAGACVTNPNYDGEVCTVTQYWSWEYGWCVDLEALCYPWQYADLTGECLEDSTYTGDSCDLEQQYWDWDTETCITIPECNPWEILDAGVCYPDDSYTGEICNAAQFYNWTWGYCEYYSQCEPWEIEDAAGFCVYDPNYTGEECSTTEYYDWTSLACVEYPNCYPWQTWDDNTELCTDDTSYTGEVCDLTTQYWDWEDWTCYDDLYECLPWEMKDINGDCIDDPDYTAEVCDAATEYYDWATFTCLPRGDCMPWEIEDAGVCYPDTSYTGVICTATQQYSWDHDICVDEAYCYPWQQANAALNCVDIPNYTGVVCDLAIEWYDWLAETCKPYPDCLPWEYANEFGDCVWDETWTGAVCDESSQTYDWTQDTCIDLYAPGEVYCQAWEEEINGVCIENPYYNGVQCEEWEILVGDQCVFVAPTIEVITSYPAYEMLYFIQTAMFDLQTIYINHWQYTHDLYPQEILAKLKQTNAAIVDPADASFIQGQYDTAVNNMINQVGYLINGNELLRNSDPGFDNGLVNLDLLMALANCAQEGEDATQDELNERLAGLNVQAISEQYLAWEFQVDEYSANELGFSLTDFEFETWAQMAIRDLTWDEGFYTVGSQTVISIQTAVFDTLASLNQSAADLGIDDYSIIEWITEIVDQVLYESCVATQTGDFQVVTGCEAWNADGTCVDFNSEPLWGCIERDESTTVLADQACLREDWVQYETCEVWNDLECHLYTWVDPWAAYEDEEWTEDYGETSFFLDPKRQITTFGTEYVMAPSGLDVYDGSIDWLNIDDDNAISEFLNSFVLLDQWNYPYTDLIYTSRYDVVNAIAYAIYADEYTNKGINANYVDMNEIGLVADRLLQIEWRDQEDYHMETYRYLDVQALIIQYASEYYQIPADSLTSAVDFSKFDMDDVTRVAIKSLTWDNHVYTCNELVYVREQFKNNLTAATGLPASLFNLSDDVIDEFIFVVLDQVLYGPLANDFWNLSLSTWTDVWTGTEEEFAAEQLTWSRDLDIVYQIADAFFWPSDLIPSSFVNFDTIDTSLVLQALMTNVAWEDTSAVPKVVDPVESEKLTISLITTIGRELIQTGAEITSIVDFKPELVDLEHLYFLANDIEVVENWTETEITSVLNGMNVYQFVLDYAEHAYGVSASDISAVINLTTSTDLDSIAMEAMLSLNWSNDDGTYTIDALDTVRTSIYTLIDSILVSAGSAAEIGVTDALIDEYVHALVAEVIYSDIPDYVHEGFVNWLAEDDIVEVAKDIVIERFGVSETFVSEIFNFIDVWGLAYYTLDNLQSGVDATTQETFYYISDSVRSTLHNDVRDQFGGNVVNLGSVVEAGVTVDRSLVNVNVNFVTDDALDTIIDEIIDILAYGDPADFNDAEWLVFMTDFIQDETLTAEDVTDFLLYKQEGWTSWMKGNKVDYENWRLDNEVTLDAFANKFLDLIQLYVTDPEALAEWKLFNNPIDDWVEQAADILPPKAQKQFQKFQQTEAFYDAQPRKQEWDALIDSLKEIFWLRVENGKEFGADSRLLQAAPELLSRCDPDRQTLGDSLYAQSSEVIFKHADLLYMQGFLGRVYDWVCVDYIALGGDTSTGVCA